MTTKLMHGMMIAMTAGALFAGACKKSDDAKGSTGARPAPAAAAATPTTPGAAATPASATAPGEKVAKVHCGGVNACKGQGGCKSAANACKGQNGCKGQSFIEATEQECKDKGGQVMAM